MIPMHKGPTLCKHLDLGSNPASHFSPSRADPPELSKFAHNIGLFLLDVRFSNFHTLPSWGWGDRSVGRVLLQRHLGVCGILRSCNTSRLRKRAPDHHNWYVGRKAGSSLFALCAASRNKLAPARTASRIIEMASFWHWKAAQFFEQHLTVFRSLWVGVSI